MRAQLFLVGGLLALGTVAHAAAPRAVRQAAQRAADTGSALGTPYRVHVRGIEVDVTRTTRVGRIQYQYFKLENGDVTLQPVRTFRETKTTVSESQPRSGVLFTARQRKVGTRTSMEVALRDFGAVTQRVDYDAASGATHIDWLDGSTQRLSLAPGLSGIELYRAVPRLPR